MRQPPGKPRFFILVGVACCIVAVVCASTWWTLLTRMAQPGNVVDPNPINGLLKETGYLALIGTCLILYPLTTVVERWVLRLTGRTNGEDPRTSG